MTRLTRAPAATVVLALLALPALLPIAATVLAWSSPETGIWAHQLEYVLPRVALNTLLLVFWVGLGSLLLGAGLGWLVAFHDFPGRGLFSWALLLPLAVPGYVLAVVAAGTLDYAGPVQSWLRAVGDLDLQRLQVRSLGGAALVLILTLYPYVYLLARVAFEGASRTMLEVAMTLGEDRRGHFRRVVLPMARPALAAGVALVCMETVADFGVVAAFNVDTLTTAIYRTWYGLFSLQAALQLAGLLVVVVMATAWLERRSRGREAYAATRPERERLPRQRLRGARAWAAMLAALMVLGLAFLLPVLQLSAWAWQHAADLDARYLDFALRSVGVAGSGALLVVAAALLHGYALARAGHAVARGLGRLATLGYALPGAVLAVGVFAPLNALGGVLQGTLVIMFIAYLARFLAVAAGPVEGGLARIHGGLDEAAATLGASGPARLRRVHLPLLKGSLLVAAILVFVDLMKELPITLMTRPFGFETLSVRIFEMAAEGEWTRAALPAVMIVLVGLLPVYLLSRRMDHVA
jgi:iron(III) transport system permease protein